MSGPAARRWGVLGLLVAPLLAVTWLLGAPRGAAGQSGDSGALELRPVPFPAPGAVEEVAARELRAAHEAVTSGAAGVERSGDELAESYGELGRIYAAYGLWEPAAAAFDNAIALAPSTPEWTYLAGYVRERSGALEEAASHYRDAVELAPGASAPRARLARAFLELDRPDEAEPLLRALVERSSTAAVAHFGLGTLAARRGDSDAAVEHFEAVLERQPGASQVHYPLAQAYRRQGDLESARRHLRRHAEAGEEPGRVAFPDPLVERLTEAAGGSALHKFRGDQALLAGDTAGAAASYRRAVAADPESFWAHKSLGLTLWELGRGEEARRVLERAIGLDPRLPPAQVRTERARIRFALAGIAANRGRAAEAIEQFRRAADLDSGYADPWLQIGNLHGQAGRLEEALAAFDRALERDPDLPEALLQRATTRMDLGRFGAAREDLERYLALRPGDARAEELLEICRRRS